MSVTNPKNNQTSHFDDHNNCFANLLEIRRRLVNQFLVSDGTAVRLKAPVVSELTALVLFFPEIFARRHARRKGVNAVEAQVDFEAGEEAAGKVFAGAQENSKRFVAGLDKVVPVNHHCEFVATNREGIAVDPMLSLRLCSVVQIYIIDGPDMRACPLALLLRWRVHIEQI
jgi:hypothetical protein